MVTAIPTKTPRLRRLLRTLTRPLRRAYVHLRIVAADEDIDVLLSEKWHAMYVGELGVALACETRLKEHVRFVEDLRMRLMDIDAE